jgi:hypothetical protein
LLVRPLPRVIWLQQLVTGLWQREQQIKKECQLVELEFSDLIQHMMEKQ